MSPVPEPSTLAILLVILLVILAVVVAPFALLVYPKTRRLGMILLGLGGLLVVVAGLFVFWWEASVTEPIPANWRNAHRRTYRRISPSPPAPLPPAGEGSSSPRAEIEPEHAAAKKPPTPLLLAMVQAVRQVLAEGPKKPPQKPSNSVATEAENKLPDWVNRPPQVVGDVYRMSLTIGPYTTRSECDAKLPEELQKALNQYVQTCLGDQAAAGVVLPEAEFRQEIVKGQQEEVRRYSVGPMVSLHVLLEFDRTVKDRILEEHRRAAIGRRMWILGAGLVSLLGVLGVTYGYLRLGARS